MGVERSYIIVMVLAGALAGLAGCSQILGTNPAITGDIDAGIGFDGDHGGPAGSRESVAGRSWPGSSSAASRPAA